MTGHEVRTMSLVIAPKGEPIFSECATHVRIVGWRPGGILSNQSNLGFTPLDKPRELFPSTKNPFAQFSGD